MSTDDRTNFEGRDPLPVAAGAAERVAHVADVLMVVDTLGAVPVDAHETVLARRELAHLLCHECDGEGVEQVWSKRQQDRVCGLCHGSGLSETIRLSVLRAEKRRMRSIASRDHWRNRRAAAVKAARAEHVRRLLEEEHVRRLREEEHVRRLMEETSGD